eukprot:gene366-1756_t
MVEKISEAQQKWTPTVEELDSQMLAIENYIGVGGVKGAFRLLSSLELQPADECRLMKGAKRSGAWSALDAADRHAPRLKQGGRQILVFQILEVLTRFSFIQEEHLDMLWAATEQEGTFDEIKVNVYQEHLDMRGAATKQEGTSTRIKRSPSIQRIRATITIHTNKTNTNTYYPVSLKNPTIRSAIEWLFFTTPKKTDASDSEGPPHGRAAPRHDLAAHHANPCGCSPGAPAEQRDAGCAAAYLFTVVTYIHTASSERDVSNNCGQSRASTLRFICSVIYST